MQKRLEPLAMAAYFLRNAAPAEWAHFLQQFEAEVRAVTVAVTVADPAVILNVQGRAQYCHSLLGVFKECETIGSKPQQPSPPVPRAP